jgi:hypothetical protein
MAREFGFANATEFALVVESWTQEARRNCLGTFYKRREAKLIREGLAKEEDVKTEAKAETDANGEDVKMETKTDIDHKERVKEEVKDEYLETKSILKADDIKTDETNEKVVVKAEALKTEPLDTKGSEEVKIKMDGSSKRASIFLSDDDDDDEL